MNYEEKPLGLWGRIKAKRLAWQLRRRWKKDPQFKARVQNAIETATRKALKERKTINTE